FKFGLRALLGEDRDASFGTVLDDGTGVKIHLRMPKEVVKMNINPKKEQPKEQEANSPNPKENKLKAKLNQWKTEQNQSNVSVVVKKG
ncbi:MAG: hypothetical protein EBS17_05045, partial [Flavobacteriia bacterium]|nr:hypothetical protein [Flavobacteriia bacterium]